MKILLVAKFYMPGSGDRSYMFALERLLRQNGHDVAIFAMHHPGELETPFSDYFAEHVNYDTVRKGMNPVKIWDMLCRTLYSTEASKKIDKLLKQFKPDIVHIQHLDTHLTYSILSSIKKQAIPVVWTQHIYAPLCINYTLVDENKKANCQMCKGGKFYQPILRRCKKGSLKESAMGSLVQYFNSFVLRYWRFVNAFVCPSRSVMDTFVDWGFPEKHLHVIPNFIDVTSVLPSYENGRYGLYAGRLTREKGVGELLAALKGTAIPFVFVGDGPMKDEVVRASGSDQWPNMTYLGYKKGEEYQGILGNSQFLVAPSISVETFGLVVLDAFSHGKPVVASAAGGLAEIVDNNQNGYLVEAGNPDRLKEKIEQLYCNYDTLSRMGRAARHKAETIYHPSVHYDKIMQLYTAFAGEIR